MPKPYELVIFDCDGVLVDSERLLVGVHAQVLAAMGWPVDRQEVIDRFVGRTFEHMAGELSAHLGRELPDGWDAEFAHLYQAALDTELEPVPGIATALDRITIPTCVASGASHRRLRRTLERTNLLERFTWRIFSANDVARPKPAPDLFLHAARQMCADPSRCAVVEDSAPGIQAALAAGMDAYAYAGGVTPAARLAHPGVTVFADMADLPALLQ